MSGWIRLHRQITKSDIYQMPPLYLRVFERLLLEANHKKVEIPYKEKATDKMGKKLIKRGERLTSIRQICEWVGWYERGRFKQPSTKTILKILDWLEENNMIQIYGTKGNRKETHYKVVNYGVYQSDDAEVGNSPENSKETVRKQSGKRNNNDKECIRMIKNDKEDILSSQQVDDEDEEKPKLKFDADAVEIQLAQFMISEMLRVKPDSKVPKDNVKSLQNWATDIDRMIRLDKRTPKQIAELFRWAQNDSFWCSNIRSPQKLRKQWDTLELQRNRKKAKHEPQKRIPRAFASLMELEEGGGQ